MSADEPRITEPSYYDGGRRCERRATARGWPGAAAMVAAMEAAAPEGFYLFRVNLELRVGSGRGRRITAIALYQRAGLGRDGPRSGIA